MQCHQSTNSREGRHARNKCMHAEFHGFSSRSQLLLALTVKRKPQSSTSASPVMREFAVPTSPSCSATKRYVIESPRKVMVSLQGASFCPVSEIILSLPSSTRLAVPCCSQHVAWETVGRTRHVSREQGARSLLEQRMHGTEASTCRNMYMSYYTRHAVCDTPLHHCHRYRCYHV